MIWNVVSVYNPDPNLHSQCTLVVWVSSCSCDRVCTERLITPCPPQSLTEISCWPRSKNSCRKLWEKKAKIIEGLKCLSTATDPCWFIISFTSSKQAGKKNCFSRLGHAYMASQYGTWITVQVILMPKFFYFFQLHFFLVGVLCQKKIESNFCVYEQWDVQPKLKNMNSKHSSEESHEELKARSWTDVRNKDSRILESRRQWIGCEFRGPRVHERQRILEALLGYSSF